jgi:plasmid stability protein
VSEQLSGRELVPQPPVVSRSGGIAVRTTERGLPTQLKIRATEMSRAPEDLAREILSLCTLSAMRLQAARRRDLSAQGFSSETIRDLKLATEEELAAAEQQARGDDPEDDQTLPGTWLGTT